MSKSRRSWRITSPGCPIVPTLWWWNFIPSFCLSVFLPRSSWTIQENLLSMPRGMSASQWIIIFEPAPTVPDFSLRNALLLRQGILSSSWRLNGIPFFPLSFKGPSNWRDDAHPPSPNTPEAVFTVDRRLNSPFPWIMIGAALFFIRYPDNIRSPYGLNFTILQ